MLQTCVLPGTFPHQYQYYTSRSEGVQRQIRGGPTKVQFTVIFVNALRRAVTMRVSSLTAAEIPGTAYDQRCTVVSLRATG